MSKHQDGESTPDGGTPQRENLCAHAAQTLFTHTKHTRKRTKAGGGLRLRGRKHEIVHGACDTAHAGGGCEVADVVVGSPAALVEEGEYVEVGEKM